MSLAEELNIKAYLCPSGRCLLHDVHFTKRFKDYRRYNNTLPIKDVMLLKLGRHFRLEGCKIDVGRNETANQTLHSTTKQDVAHYLEVIDYMGPIPLLRGTIHEKVVKKAPEIPVRYSDTP